MKLPPYLKEWLEHRFGRPVRFPRHSLENFLLSRSTRRAPANALARRPEEDCAISLPDCAIRRPEVYNYLGRRAKAKVVQQIEQLFVISLWTCCAPYITQRTKLTPTIEAWCKDNGISCSNEEAVRQKFYRIRANYSKHGILLGKKYKKKSS